MKKVVKQFCQRQQQWNHHDVKWRRSYVFTTNFEQTWKIFLMMLIFRVVSQNSEKNTCEAILF